MTGGVALGGRKGASTSAGLGLFLQLGLFVFVVDFDGVRNVFVVGDGFFREGGGNDACRVGVVVEIDHLAELRGSPVGDSLDGGACQWVVL